MTDEQLVTALAEILAARCTGWAWRASGVYSADEIGIYYGSIGSTMDRGCGLTLYAAVDPLVPGESGEVRRVQLRFRGAPDNPAGADSLADQAFGALHRLSRTSGLSLVQRVLVAPLGADDNARQERADSYQIILENMEAS